jgi:excisionase family DNA binding protein
MNNSGISSGVLLKPKDLVTLLGVSRATIHEMLHRGEIPAVIIRSGSRKKTFRIYADAVDRWLGKNSTKGSKGFDSAGWVKASEDKDTTMNNALLDIFVRLSAKRLRRR